MVLLPLHGTPVSLYPKTPMVFEGVVGEVGLLWVVTCVTYTLQSHGFSIRIMVIVTHELETVCVTIVKCA